MSLEQTRRRQQQQQPLHICITGTSQGIGLAAAKRLIAEGHVVYHACRSVERAQAAAAAAGGGVVIETAACDLADLNAVKQFAQALQVAAPRLDVLCLNAGMAPSSTRSKPALTAQGLEACIGINHVGHFLLLQLLYNNKLLVSRNNKDNAGHEQPPPPPPRVIITSSSVHDPAMAAGRSGSGVGATLGNVSGLGHNLRTHPEGPTMVDGATTYDPTKVYKDAKLCNILTANHAAREWPGICTASFNPGLVTETGLFRALRQDSWIKATALTWAAWMIGFSVPVDVAANRLCYLVTTTTTPQGGQADSAIKSGTYYAAPAKSHGTTPATGFVPTNGSQEAADPVVAKRLWERSLEIVRDWL